MEINVKDEKEIKEIKEVKEVKTVKAKILTANDVAQTINSIAPIGLQEEWDNSGMMIGFEEKPVKKILTCLEITDDIVNEAIDMDADMIVTHHPFIFGGLNNICDSKPKDKLIIDIIKNEISVYSCHTPFDKVKGGNNDIIMKRLGLTSIKNLIGEDVESPSKMAERKTVADIGRIGRFK